jgi:hypothetical protein
MIKLYPIKCRNCGKLFLCRGRFNLVNNGHPIPHSHCIDKTECTCDICHSINKESEVCSNISLVFNPSNRYIWDYS